MMICIGIEVPLAVFAVMLQEQKRQQTSKHNNSTQKFSCDRAYPRLKTSMFQKSLSKGKLLWFLAPMDEKHCCCNFRIFSILSLVNWQRETSRLQHLFPTIGLSYLYRNSHHVKVVCECFVILKALATCVSPDLTLTTQLLNAR